MKMRVTFAAAVLAAGAFLGSSVAQAASVDLTQSFSSASTTNGDWTYAYSQGVLSHFATHNDQGGANPNHLKDALGNGFLGTGDNLNANTPFIFKASKDGSGVGLSDGDFLENDVVIHTPNDLPGTLTITWKAPSAGEITNLLGGAWYAHSSVTRSNTASLTVAGASVFTNIVVSGASNADRDHPGGTFLADGTPDPAGAFTVAKDDLVTLTLFKTSGQQYGSLNGVRLSFDFAPATVPIPATLPLFAAGIAGLGWIARRKRQAAA